MNTSDAIRARRSIRKYKKGTVIPKEHIHQMLEAAQCLQYPSLGICCGGNRGNQGTDYEVSSLHSDAENRFPGYCCLRQA